MENFSRFVATVFSFEQFGVHAKAWSFYEDDELNFLFFSVKNTLKVLQAGSLKHFLTENMLCFQFHTARSF